MKKLLALILALAFMVCLGCSKTPSEPVDIGDAPAAEPETPVEEPAVQMNSTSGAAAMSGGKTYSVAARADGSVVFVGHNVDGQSAAAGWTGIASVGAGDNVVIGAKFDGTTLLAGAVDAYSAAAAWTNVAKVAAGSGHVVGLMQDGSVAAAGDNGAGQCNVTGWSGIASIAAAGNHTVGLQSDGTVVVAGDVADPGWTGMIAVAAAPSYIVGLASDGTVKTTGSGDVSALTGLTDVAACDDFILGVKEDGTVVTNGSVDVSAITAAVCAAGGAKHVIVMKEDGSAVAVGSNDELQCEVGGWQLRPYVQDGFLYGFGPKMTVAQVKNALAVMTGGEVAIKSAGADAADADLVKTGDEAHVNGSLYGAIVIKGDINGNGEIDIDDANAIDAHVAGKQTLTGAALQAALILDGDGEVKSGYANYITRYIDGQGSINQYKSGDNATYAQKIAEAKNVNKDVTGWITIDGTSIDFPIMKATDDYHYNDYNWKNEKSALGSAYMLFNEARQGQLYVFTAHNNRKRTDKGADMMFHELHHVVDRNLGKTKCGYDDCKIADLSSTLPDFNTYAGRVFRINILGEDGLWEIFSTYEVSSDKRLETLADNIWHSSKSESEVRKWIDKQIEKSDIKMDVKVGTSDKLLTVYTCGTKTGDDGARLYMFFHKVG